jgi:ribonuclease D
MHAAAQDLEVLDQACGAIPSFLFDTQIAAGFVGYGTPSLVSLVEGELRVRLPKGDRLTDWLRRPLDEAQCSYAASDVVHLLQLRQVLLDRLDEAGRRQWVARQLRGKSRGVIRAVAAWRERRAAELDLPVRHVLSDLAVVGIAQKAPTSVDQLKSVRGLDGRHLRGEVAAQLLDAVKVGGDSPLPEPRSEPTPELDRDLRPAVTLVSAWLSQLGRDLSIETSLLGTRADIEGLLAGTRSRLAEGWRADLVGEPIRRLVDGGAALAFQGRGRLVLEARSRRPLDSAPLDAAASPDSESAPPGPPSD